MNRRILPTFVAVLVCAFPAAASAQTSTYDSTPPTTTMPSTNPTTPTTKAKPTTTPKSGVAGTDAAATTPAPAVAPATATTPATGTTPTTLAYTGSDVWLVALLGAFALMGGIGLVRSSRTSS